MLLWLVEKKETGAQKECNRSKIIEIVILIYKNTYFSSVKSKKKKKSTVCALFV